MVTVQIASAKGRPLKLVKSLPTSLDFPQKSAKDVKIGDVKAKLAERYPRVCIDYFIIVVGQYGVTEL
jgi:hypothetical protein